MKIGILGNMNNMYFSLARYLADEGYNCELLVFADEPNHFHPMADTFQSTINICIKQLTWGVYGRMVADKAIVANDLKDYNFLIGNGIAPAVVNSIGRQLDLFIPFGGDLYHYPFFQLKSAIRFKSYMDFVRNQRSGILRCPVILFDRTSPAFERIFERLAYKGLRIVCPAPLFYWKEYDTQLSSHEKENPHFDILQQLRYDNDFIILQHVRQLWLFHWDYWSRKGNDKLIKGFASFLQQNPGVKAKLLLLEYSVHVKATKALIRKLGIENHVVWFPKTLRKYLMSFVKISDLVVGELQHSWNTYCVMMEALAMGKPLMHKRTDAHFKNDYSQLYPMLHASTPHEVLEGLKFACYHPQELKQMGIEGQAWFKRNCVETPLAHIKELIAAKAYENGA